MTEPKKENVSTREDREITRDSTDRESRTPLGRARLKLTAPVIPGHVLRWINDDNSRIPSATAGGYQFVKQSEVGHIGESVSDGNSDAGDRVSKIVGKQTNGQPLRAYLMKIKKDWYDADQAEKLKPVDEIETAIKRGSLEEGPDSNRYIPKEGIKID